MTEIRFYDTADDALLRFAVIVARSNGKWVLCKHRERESLELPGGHREPGESIRETAVRELREETGAADFDLRPVCAYSLKGELREGLATETESFGMLYTAEIRGFGPLHSEMERIVLMDTPPQSWVYPIAHPRMIEEAVRRKALSPEPCSLRPALYETHAHAVLDGADFRAALRRHKEQPEEGWVRSVLETYRDHHIIYVRDGGDHNGVSLLAKRLAPEYGVEYRSPAFAIHKKGRYGAMVGRAYTDLGEFRALVDEVKALGGDFIKIMFSGIMDFGEYGALSCEPLDAAEMAELVKIAHGEGFAVMVHCNGADAVKAALAAGVDSLEHGYYQDEQALRDLAASDCVWVPTLAPVANLIGLGRFPDEVTERITEGQRANVRTAALLGAAVAPGSDAGAFAVPHGGGTLDEYRWLAGFVHEETLQAGAETIRRKFRRE